MAFLSFSRFIRIAAIFFPTHACFLLSGVTFPHQPPRSSPVRPNVRFLLMSFSPGIVAELPIASWPLKTCSVIVPVTFLHQTSSARGNENVGRQNSFFQTSQSGTSGCSCCNLIDIEPFTNCFFPLCHPDCAMAIVSGVTLPTKLKQRRLLFKVASLLFF